MYSLTVPDAVDLVALTEAAVVAARPGEAVVVTLPCPPLAIGVIPHVSQHARDQLLREGATLDATGRMLVVPMMVSPRERSYRPTSVWAAREGVPVTLQVALLEAELAFAITDYKVQGKTLDYFVVLLRRPADGRVRPRLELPHLEVLLSRVRRGTRLFVLGFDPACPADRDWLKGLRRSPDLFLWMNGYSEGRWDPHRVRHQAAALAGLAPPRRPRTRRSGPVPPGAPPARVGPADPSVVMPDEASRTPGAAVASHSPLAPRSSPATLAAPGAPGAPASGAVPGYHRHLVAAWDDNSCPYDAALVLWEHLQRHLSHSGRPPLASPAARWRTFHHGRASQATSEHPVLIDYTQPLAGWLAHRGALTDGAPPANVSTLRGALAAARDELRTADCLAQLPAAFPTAAAQAAALQRRVTGGGVADCVLGRLLASPATLQRLLRTTTTGRLCRLCGVHRLPPAGAVHHLLSRQLEHALRDPWAAFAGCVRAAPAPAALGLGWASPACTHRTARHAFTTHGAGDPAAEVVLLALPDQTACRLHPERAHHLPCGTAYRLRTAVYFCQGPRGIGHYVAIGHLPGEGWTCYDANAHQAVGQPCPPPSGEALSLGAGVYYPAVLAYTVENLSSASPPRPEAAPSPSRRRPRSPAPTETRRCRPCVDPLQAHLAQTHRRRMRDADTRAAVRREMAATMDVGLRPDPRLRGAGCANR